MKDFSQPRTFIFSAFQGNNQVEDERNHNELAADLALEGVRFSECTGSYQGTEERGFIVTGAGNQDVVQALCESFNQVSYLVIAENDRTAYDVVVSTGYHTHLGRFHAVGEDKPDADGWTLFDGVYFTTDNVPGVDLPRGL